jgi:NADPH:quinone reductase-like Zn-dependent oxidoreductase
VKAAVFYEPGGPEKIQLGEVPSPQFDHDQVLIQVKACSLNHFDL